MSANRTLGMYTSLCIIILSYLEENQKPFWLSDRLISIEKEEKFIFQVFIWPHVFFGTSAVTSTENLKS